jgi:hypothetical protein
MEGSIQCLQDSLTSVRAFEAKMPVYHAYIVGAHSRFIAAVQMDCADDDTAIKSASRLVDKHDVELWQMDRPVVRFEATSKQMFKKRDEAAASANDEPSECRDSESRGPLTR